VIQLSIEINVRVIIEWGDKLMNNYYIQTKSDLIEILNECINQGKWNAAITIITTIQSMEEQKNDKIIVPITDE
jgi:DNA repair photolyase